MLAMPNAAKAIGAGKTFGEGDILIEMGGCGVRAGGDVGVGVLFGERGGGWGWGRGG